MEKLFLHLENCYGIKSLQTNIDFTNQKTYTIYASNGCMKTSLAKTFKDVVEGVETRDQIYPERRSVRSITDETGAEIIGEKIVVIPPYDEFFSSEKISTLLVDNDLRKEYESLQIKLDELKESFIQDIKDQSKSKQLLEEEIILTFSEGGKTFLIF